MKPWLLAWAAILISAPGGVGSAAPGEMLYPKGWRFPIGGYSPRPERDLKAGFTLAGPTYADSRRLLETCERLGMPMVYRVRTSVDIKGRRGDPPQTLDVKALRREVREIVAAVAHSPVIYAWTVSPEELRYWRERERLYLITVCEAIREADPQKRPVWMYEPGHRDARSLAKLLPHMGICAKGMYTNYAGYIDERAWCRWSVRQQAEALEQAHPEALLFALPEMFRQPPLAREGEIRAWVRHDAYTALLGGAKGILVFSFARREGFTAHAHYYEAYAEIARELNGPEQLGRFFLSDKRLPTPRYDVDGVQTVTLAARPPLAAEETFPSVAMGRFAGEGRELLVTINSTQESLTVRLTSEGDGWSPLFSPHSLEPTLPLGPWEVALFTRPTP